MAVHTTLGYRHCVHISVPCALLAALGLASPASANDNTFWGRDDTLHFAASALIAGGTFAAGTTTWNSRLPTTGLALSVALAVGASKEVSDALGLGDASWKDFAWDVMGAVFGTSLALAADTAVRPVFVPR